VSSRSSISGQHQDACRRAGPNQGGADRVAVHLGKVPVEDHHVVGVDQGLLDPAGPVIGHIRADALIAEADGDVIRQFGLILNYEHPHEAMMPGRTSQQHHTGTAADPGSRPLTWPSPAVSALNLAWIGGACDARVMPHGVLLDPRKHGLRRHPPLDAAGRLPVSPARV